MPRIVAVGSLVTSTTAFRVGAAWLELWAKRTPPLARLAVMSALGGEEAATAAATFRDDLIALAGEAIATSSRELRRGRQDFENFTRPPGEQQPADRPHRPYRVKL